MKLIHMNLWQPDSNNPITRAGYPGGEFSSYGGEVMAKCRICKKNRAIYAWQPTIGNARENFYFLGSHIRGFTVIKVCESCKDLIQSGKPISFDGYFIQNDEFFHVSMCPYN